MAAAALLIVALVGLAAVYFRESPSERQTARFEVPIPGAAGGRLPALALQALVEPDAAAMQAADRLGIVLPTNVVALGSP